MAGEEERNGDCAKEDAKNEVAPSSSVAKADEAMRNLTVQEGLRTQAKSAKDGKDMAAHKFWSTQPVPRHDDKGSVKEGPIEPEDVSKVRQEPYPLIEGFEWVTMDMDDATDMKDVTDLLYNNYVEDDEAMFRLQYSTSFLNWALKSPGWKKEWHIGIRVSSGAKKLVAFISAVPMALRVKKNTVKCAEVNFLCVHKKLRSKRLAPILIREITRRCNQVGIWQAIYTGGVLLPTPVSTCRYFHRSIDWEKLYEVGFSHLPPGSTPQRQIMKYRLPSTTDVAGTRPLKRDDIPKVMPLLKKYLDRMQMAQVFDEEEFAHWMLDEGTPAAEQVVFSYVVEQGGKITDFYSFYRLESTVIGSKKHSNLKVAYSYYYATDAAFNKDKTLLKKRLNELMHDALILAKKEKFDVFNALTLLDNPLFLTEQKFGPGDGRLHYYLYNYRTSAIPGGVDEKNAADETKMGGVGVVML